MGHPSWTVSSAGDRVTRYPARNRNQQSSLWPARRIAVSAPTIRTTPGREVRETHSDMGGHVLLRDRAVETARGTVLHERLWRLWLSFSPRGWSGWQRGRV